VDNLYSTLLPFKYKIRHANHADFSRKKTSLILPSRRTPIPTMPLPLIFSCEHATCTVPDAFKEALANDMDTITSAAGWDLGSLNLAQGMAMKFRTPLVHCEITRLIIDCYAQQNDPSCWSELSQKLSETQREKLVERQLLPHLTTLRQRISNELERSPRVLHISVHTFDPLAHPNADVSLLFSEGKVGESTVALDWMKTLQEVMPELRVVPNVKFYPDQAKNLLDTLRSEWNSEQYLAIELQVSNLLFLENKPVRWDKVKVALIDSLKAVID
jgi:predicted N-formylglutamate amidohydrolase